MLEVIILILSAQLASILLFSFLILRSGVKFMANAQSILDALASLQTSVDALILQGQGAITPAQGDQILQGIQDIKTKVDAALNP